MKLRSGLLIALMLLSCSAFSQRDTVNKDTVKLSINTAKAVIKDLLLLDAVKQENILLKDDTSKLQSIISKQDSLISSKDKQISLHMRNENDLSSIGAAYRAAFEKEQKKVRKQKFKTTISQIALVALAIFFAVRS